MAVGAIVTGIMANLFKRRSTSESLEGDIASMCKRVTAVAIGNSIRLAIWLALVDAHG